MDGESYDIDVEGQVPLLTLYIRGKKIPVELKSEREIVRSQITSPKRKDVEHVIRAPIPGRVVKCLVKEGDKVVPEQGIIVIDAMKMENELKSPTTGTVIEISVHPGQDIEAGERLAVIT
jgi:biotin carboxyl carrier protein